ncbi:hypothetical protein Ddye_000724 [Dipteronia dyeriana]|uniref:DUF8040 domain-containing protein n=1 Tax=Dipteronia dyeriana TaxID=168575 RepID=A0AAD9XMW7_9ROSI|nr:hypothetical protein Ddye_000724 [Dipteronia dyeriana]
MNIDELDILFKDVAATREGTWAPSTNFVPNDGEDMSYNEQIAEVDKLHDIKENLNNDFDRVNGFENIEINMGSPTYVNTTEDNGRKKRKTFRSRDKVADIMLTYLDRIVEAVENKKSTKKYDTSITEAIELLCHNTSIPRKNGIFENLDDNEHENNERDDDNKDSDSDGSYGDNEHSDSDESNDDYEYLHTGVALCVHQFLKYNLKVPCRISSHTGYKFVMEVLKDHKNRCHQQFRMEKQVFIRLCNLLSQAYCLQKVVRRENLHFPNPPFRWKILRQMPNFSFRKQVNVVIASMALHNFIRIHSIKDQEFMPYDDDDELFPEEGENEREILGEEQGTNSSHEREMDEERDRIAVLPMHRE